MIINESKTKAQRQWNQQPCSFLLAISLESLSTQTHNTHINVLANSCIDIYIHTHIYTHTETHICIQNVVHEVHSHIGCVDGDDGGPFEDKNDAFKLEGQ